LTNPDIGADEYTPLSCFGVTSLSATNVTASSADLSWSSYNSGAVGIPIRYNIQGSVNLHLVSGTGTSKTLNGLSSGTIYNAQVREICSVGDTSAWSDIIDFGTELCDPISRCAHEFIMTDAFGDGWNGGTISLEQKNALNGQWIEMGEASLASPVQAQFQYLVNSVMEILPDWFAKPPEVSFMRWISHFLSAFRRYHLYRTRKLLQMMELLPLPVKYLQPS